MLVFHQTIRKIRALTIVILVLIRDLKLSLGVQYRFSHNVFFAQKSIIKKLNLANGHLSQCNEFDEYVWKKDENYKWEIKETYNQFDDVIGYSMFLHSQQWLDDSIYYIEREGPGSVVWSHWVNIWIPRTKRLDKDLLDAAILFIDGGKNSAGPPSLDDKYVKLGRLLSSIRNI